ncbi:hypothetical protein BDD12DRAFT_858185 [Trichophaea hybrida]|nr:hypothetical protein BDD12DRAFT_858185 [Trichophaea hybrida]
MSLFLTGIFPLEPSLLLHIVCSCRLTEHTHIHLTLVFWESALRERAKSDKPVFLATEGHQTQREVPCVAWHITKRAKITGKLRLHRPPSRASSLVMAGPKLCVGTASSVVG